MNQPQIENVGKLRTERDEFKIQSLNETLENERVERPKK